MTKFIQKIKAKFGFMIREGLLYYITTDSVHKGGGGSGHSGRKSQFLAPQDIPDISGYQLGIGCQFVKEHIDENPGPDQKIFQIRFVSNLDICKIVNECPRQHHVKAQVWSLET